MELNCNQATWASLAEAECENPPHSWSWQPPYVTSALTKPFPYYTTTSPFNTTTWNPAILAGLQKQRLISASTDIYLLFLLGKRLSIMAETSGLIVNDGIKSPPSKSRLQDVLFFWRRLSKYASKNKACDTRSSAEYHLFSSPRYQDRLTNSSQSKIIVPDILDSRHSSQHTTHSTSIAVSPTYAPVYSC
jgi:hypothetical protein